MNEKNNDFIDKLKILLKELRETLVALKIIKRVTLVKTTEFIDKATIEDNELICIFAKSIEKTKKGNEKVNKSYLIFFLHFNIHYSLFGVQYYRWLFNN